jgi:hypothetical protein
MKDLPEAEENIEEDCEQYREEVHYIAILPHPKPTGWYVLTAGQHVRCNG